MKKLSAIKKILLILLLIFGLFVAIQVVNAVKYKMMVNVVQNDEDIGINPLTDTLDFGDLSRNSSMTRYITMNNSGAVPVFVIIAKTGEISDLVQIGKNFFMLEKNTEQKIAFEIRIPQSAQDRKYSGSVMVFRLPKLF